MHILFILFQKKAAHFFIHERQNILCMTVSKGIKVAAKDAEKARTLLKGQGALDRKKARHNGGGTIFPVKRRDFELKDIIYEVVEEDFEDYETTDEFEKLLHSIGRPFTS